MLNKLGDSRACFNASFCSDKSELFADLPDAAFALVQRENRFFPHHKKNVNTPLQNITIDLELLLISFSRIQDSPFTAKTKLRVYKHLMNHFKYLSSHSLFDNSDESAQLFENIIEVVNDIDEKSFEDFDYKMIKVGPEKLFRVGKWNGQEYNKEDLEGIENTFRELKDTFLPPLKMGHHQNKVPNPCEEKAEGYVVDLWYDGEYLNGIFEYDPYFWEFNIKNRKFRYKSIELWKNYEQNGRVFKNCLTGVALLGVSPPAVLGLGELKTIPLSYSSDNQDREYLVFDAEKDIVLENGKEEKMTDVNDVAQKEIGIVQNLDNEEILEEQVQEEQVQEEQVQEEQVQEEVKMSAEEKIEMSKEQFDSLSARLISLEAATSENHDLKAQLTQTREALDLMYKDAKTQEYDFYSENLVKAGKITPAQKETVMALFSAIQPKAMVTFNGENTNVVELFKKFLEEFKSWPANEEVGQINTTVATETLPLNADPVVEYGICKGVRLPMENIDVSKRALNYIAEQKKNGITVDFRTALVEVTRS